MSAHLKNVEAIHPGLWRASQLGRALGVTVDTGYPALLQQDVDVMSNLFAFCVAATGDSISPVDRAHPVNEVANTLELNFTHYWKPTRAG
ncbi:hypothetical protein [Paraburkholderia domus]|uniref:hypothetical protein n=1 Tax=Paraburkholderia domus TaxID=2793075 RepID=UPI001B050B64|nr:hypothetical protein [Paraburkholderia domus]CAE6820669.1 hypothetical protein R75483_06226 [Paraburkholderia domus]CAE6862442.1 hypothetical protein R70006_08157 [Paraburkholderia domus]CAE6887390.1 hypothetical protein R69749_07402 [Paraburkholderia domus]